MCGQFEWIAGATPAFLICNQVRPNSFFKTDLEFGGRNGRAALLIVGKELKEQIESRRFRGIYFHDAYCASDKYKEDKVH